MDLWEPWKVSAIHKYLLYILQIFYNIPFLSIVQASIDYALLNSQEFLMTMFFTLPKILIIIIYHITVVKLLRKQKNEICQTFLSSYVLCTSVLTNERKNYMFLIIFAPLNSQCLNREVLYDQFHKKGPIKPKLILKWGLYSKVWLLRAP